MQCWIYQWKLARFTKRIYVNTAIANLVILASVSAVCSIFIIKIFIFEDLDCSGLSTFTQDAMRQTALFRSAVWWGYVMWNARIKSYRSTYFLPQKNINNERKKEKSVICFQFFSLSKKILKHDVEDRKCNYWHITTKESIKFSNNFQKMKCIMGRPGYLLNPIIVGHAIVNK